MVAYRPRNWLRRRAILLLAPNRREGGKAAQGILAGGAQGGKGVVGAVHNAVAILESVLRDAPTTKAKSAA